jgi:hypothetical protein
MCPWLLASELMGHPPGPWSKDCWFWVGRELPVVAAVKQMGPPQPRPEPKPTGRSRLVTPWMTEEEAQQWLDHFSQFEEYQDLFGRETRGNS